MTNRFFQSLESRTFLSVTPVHTDGVNPKLTADRLQYSKDIAQYVSDANLMNQTLAADKAKVAQDCASLQQQQTNCTKKLNDDTKLMQLALSADGAAGSPTSAKWQPILAADQAQMKIDHEHKDLVAKDQTKYNADYAQFRSEMAKFEAQTKADIARWNAILAADKANCITVTTVVKNETSKTEKTVKGSAGEELNPLITRLKTDQTKLNSDQTMYQNKLKADQAKITADSAQMKKDGGGDANQK